MIFHSHLVDTDWIIEFLKGNKEVINKLSLLIKRGNLCISIISLAELYEGIYRSRGQKKHLQGLNNFVSGVIVLNIDDEICKIFGKERASLRREGNLIDNFDLLIASTCLAYDLVLITDNIKHFERIKSLRVSDNL